MIQFSCSCGQKFKVKDDCAGRKSTCPTCKQSLVVPSPDKIQACPKSQIDGTASSIAQAGFDGGVTLDQATRPGQKPFRNSWPGRARKGERYIIEGEIARGGMGAVLRAVDCDIRREVAVKFMLGQIGPEARSCVSSRKRRSPANSNTPTSSPIHELGVDAQKRLFFSMKMVRAAAWPRCWTSCGRIPRTPKRTTRSGRLLNILVNVCNALAYAHSRGVVHRDLKPANIMVGDFGEVYVMDWGLAKLLNGDGQAREASAAAAKPFLAQPLLVPLQ